VLPVSAVVAAAGLSTRFGGPNKLLQPWDDSTIVGTVVSTLLSCGLPAIVVTGRDALLVAETVAPAQTVFNPEFQSGLGTSIACGVRTAPAGHGVLIALGDMPSLRREVVLQLLAGYDAPDAIVAPAYADEPDRPGHPVLFGLDYREALCGLSGDEGAREVLQANRRRLILLPVLGGLEDIDEP
jgi:molybdenum cofactor cytidylyltransferase